MGDRAPHALADFADFESIAIRDLGDFLGSDTEEHDGLVEDLVGLDVMEQDEGSAPGISRHEHTGAANADDVFAAGNVAEFCLGDLVGVDLAEDFRLAGFPRVHDCDHAGGDGDREPAAVHEFMQGGEEENRIDTHENSTEGERTPEGPFPVVAHHDVERVSRDDHGAGDRDTVGGGEAVARTEAGDDRDGGEGEGGVDEGNVDLADLVGVGVGDCKSWEIAELDGGARQ